MSQQPQRRQINENRSTRNSKEDLTFTFQQDQSKWRKKAWTEQEDQFLIKLVAKHGAQKWSLIAESLPGRIGKQCRERWHNHLNPDINKNEWTQQEEWILFLLHKNMGNQWAQFTKYLKGRTDNSIKNHWNSIMRKRSAHYMERYKNIISRLQESKEAGNKEVDNYLLEKLESQMGFQGFQKWENDVSKVQSKEDIPTKSVVQGDNNNQTCNYLKDLEKTVKKKIKNQTFQRSEDKTTKIKRQHPFNFNLNLNTRLSQLSVFGPQSRQNIVSAFSLLEEGQPIVLERQPSFNDFSLSIHCFEEQRQYDLLAKESNGKIREEDAKKSKQYLHQQLIQVEKRSLE